MWSILTAAIKRLTLYHSLTNALGSYHPQEFECHAGRHKFFYKSTEVTEGFEVHKLKTNGRAPPKSNSARLTNW